MSINRQGNLYTIIFAAVLVAVVGFVLSIVYIQLRPKQLENIKDDTRKQILASIRVVPADKTKINEDYTRYITDSFIVNDRGEKVDKQVDPFDVNVSEEVKKPDQERLLPVFVATTPEGTKYIIPVYGAGLWGPIWGYVAFDDNGDTIYGAYFSHSGETPGLGAEIEKPAFQDQFRGKNVFENGDFTSVAVVKKGQEPKSGDYVNAISGGTITSSGVSKMLSSCLQPYSSFFIKLQEKKAPEAQTK